ncbi:3-oxoacyl-ACP reductase [Nocardia seriolae]|uniref:3-oxoacyl-[acyl-carrier-protein] reductase n=1 Tax=Nocardia seriolae TaxID=37332 RepID=A0ABC8AMR1_9NOCA|nr:3-oxoacyl-ACP reductase [Nocardia seriolae]APA95390.1 3-oxoacyl-[acyl-carrier-protein] reductase [Nocardia seriolae]QOW31715.1 3-oxoacyl-ACP reductase [Nocardia seriolae]QUN19327.1 3-oxoacyl-ACP reductase [Nocardia seriolae]WKY53164.1 3-oxoacyl-ACP reductase [Nocardia seriolae]WNJ58766.1 3-oxoacyl-ACP reductase [Nocardia seriolae]
MSDSAVSLAGRVAIVTGAGAGLGRAEALELARAGASIIVNDLAENDTVSATLADIRALGVKAEFVAGSIAESATAEALIRTAEETFGRLDIVVNNAGITRDKMLFNMSDADFDAVVAVHLRGHFLLTRNAAAYWRGEYKETGAPVYGRIINTSSEAGLLGPAGQANYGAAKAGITALTLSAARALESVGVRANAIAPRARTAMTEKVFSAAPEQGPDPLSPDHVARLVAYLASPAADAISGQLFVVYGPMVALMAAPVVEQRFDAEGEWTREGLAASLGGYFAERGSDASFSASSLKDLG